MKINLKVITLVVSLFCISVVTIEILATLFIKIYYKKSFNELKNQIKVEQINSTNSHYIAHPILSYVSNSPESNNMGFFSKYDYPYERKKNDFVIGVFGGSLADIMSGQFDSLKMADYFKEKITLLKNKNVVILSFASGCAKQPIHFQRFSRFASDIDLAINIDGINELVFNAKGADITTPCMTETLYYNSVYQKDFDPILNTVVFYTTALKTRMLQNILFEKSALFLITTNFVIKLKEKTETALQNNIHDKIENSKSKLFPFDTKDDKRDLYLLGVENWAKYNKLQFAVSQELKVPILFVLAPNILFKNTKPLSAVEESFMQGNGKVWAARSVEASRVHSKLQNELNSLKLKNQNNFIDLSGIFKNETQTLYTDAQGHCNEQGNRIVWENVINKLKNIVKQ